MSTINGRIQEFINTHELPDTDEFRESLADFVSGCWSDHFKIVMEKTIPDDKPAKGSKVSKENKIEDPTECKSRDDIRNCTSGTLNEFCKKQGLRVGGNKTEIMDRVWRYLQGNNSEEDMSPRNKPKKEKKVNEKHDCYGCTSKGTPCAVAATVEVDGHWFCWRHEENAQEIIENKNSSSNKKSPAKSEKKSEKSEKSEKKAPAKASKSKKAPVSEDELKTDDSDTEKKVSKKPVAKAKGNGKKKEPEPEPSDDEEESEEEEEDQQETGDELEEEED
jgi:hypothetical protein